ncbi:hypothetical protein [Kangiella sp. M94]
MEKTKIALIIVLLLIVSALLVVTVFSRENSEAVISAKQVEDEEAYSQLESIKPDSQDVTIEKQIDESDVTKVEDIADDSINAPNEESPPSGVDIKTDHEQVAEQFENEEEDYHWSGYWQNELQTIVLFVGAKAFVENAEVECKSSTCEVSVELSVKGPQNTVEAVGALSDEFAQRELKFVPASIDPESGEIVFYTQPGDIPE